MKRNVTTAALFQFPGLHPFWWMNRLFIIIGTVKSRKMAGRSKVTGQHANWTWIPWFCHSPSAWTTYFTICSLNSFTLFVRQNLTNSSFLVAWWIDSSCWIRRLFKHGREDFSWVTSGFDKTSELRFLSFPITEVSPINCARWSAESISCLLPFEDTKIHLRRTSIRIVFDKFIHIEEAFLSAAVSSQRRSFSPLSCPTSHATKEESLSIWPVSVLYARDVRCVPGQDFRKANKDNMESKL